MSKPKVSVVIPAFNAENTIAETLYSLFWQSFRNFEIIVVDDGSSDRTGKIVESLKGCSPVLTYLYQKNKGPAAARNKGFSHSQGEYLIWVDADDIWLPQRLEMLVSFLDKNANVDLVTSDAYLWYPPAKIKGTYYSTYPLPKEFSFTNLLQRNFVFTSTLMRRSVWSKTGGLNESRNIIGVEDYEFWLRVLKKNFKLAVLGDPLMFYRINPKGLSAKKPKVNQALLEIFALVRRLNLTAEEEKIICQRERELKLHLAQSYAKDKNLDQALVYFQQLPSLWARLSFLLLQRRYLKLWRFLFKAKRFLGKLKRKI